MHLDLPTLVVMGSFVAFCAGVVLLLAWVQNRKVSALATWGFANLANAVGILCLVLGPALRQPAWSILSAIFLASGPGLIWKASRDLDAKPGPLVVALSGAIMVALASVRPPWDQEYHRAAEHCREFDLLFCGDVHAVDRPERASLRALAADDSDGRARRGAVNRHVQHLQWLYRRGRNTAALELVRPHPL
jgi:hypothetical protein